MPRHTIEQRSGFRFFTPIQVRWGDLDPFNHVNNVLYYRFFEVTIVNFLAAELGINLAKDPPFLTFVAENRCVFNKPIDLSDFGPQGVTIDGAIRVDRLGSSSITWGLALFRPGEENAAAQGDWTHVVVDRDTARPMPIPDAVRAILQPFAS